MNTIGLPGEQLRITPQQLKARLESGEAVTVIDARNRSDWESSPVRIRGAVRFHARNFQEPPPWPRDQLTVVY